MKIRPRRSKLPSSIGLIALLITAASWATSSTTPPTELLKSELQYELPVMWRLTDLAVEDPFTNKGDGRGLWKARFRATIETIEATYVPTDLDVGAVTVVRPAYPAGVTRQLHGRLAASLTATGGWEIDFMFDNRPTMTAGLPKDYFTGQVVEAGSDRHLELVEQQHDSLLQKAVRDHQAALRTARIQHDEKLRALEASLAEADRLAALEANLETRVSTLREAVQILGSAVDRLATEVASEGIELSQWAASAGDSTIVSRRGSTAAELVGAPDVEECQPKARTHNAWFVGAHETGEPSVRVDFLEPVIPTVVAVYEQASSGFVKTLQLHGEQPGQSAVRTVVDIDNGCAQEALFPITGITFPVRAVTITVDASKPGNKAIDAVQLRGVKRFE